MDLWPSRPMPQHRPLTLSHRRSPVKSVAALSSSSETSILEAGQTTTTSVGTLAISLSLSLSLSLVLSLSMVVPRYLGHLALLVIYEDTITDLQAACLFDNGEAALPHPGGATSGFQDASGAFTGWGGAVDYCISQGASGVCPLATYCPNGPGGEPAGGRRRGDQWAPYLAPGRVNKWVQVGTMGNDPTNTCDPDGPQTTGDGTIHSGAI